jgi:hypothetical protein
MERSQKTWEAFVEADCERLGNEMEGYSSSSWDRSFVIAHHRRRLLLERLKEFPLEPAADGK